MRRHILLTTLILAAPRAALACPVCFGQNDSPLALGANMAIWAMLAVTIGVLAAFASFFIYLMRRARLFDENGQPVGTGRQARDARSLGSDSQEGTAQC